MLTLEHPLSTSGGSLWRQGQLSPAEQEHNFAVYGCTPTAGQVAEAESLIARGHFQPKELRAVGLLKFMHHALYNSRELISAGGFQNEEILWRYILAPFPWLLMAVYTGDVKHDFSAWHD
jgi:hypothetical protein